MRRSARSSPRSRRRWPVAARSRSSRVRPGSARRASCARSPRSPASAPGCSRPPATISSRRARWGRCTTPRRGRTGRWPRALASEGAVFSALLEELGEVPTVLIVEDAHWADDATLDVLGYVARRVESLPALLVLTLRDEAVDRGHPLHRLLGMLATGPVHRLELEPLSAGAVRRLADGTGRDADAVHALTRGNPFFVAEALAAPPDEVPASVKDAVLARVRLLSPPCRDALERLSVIPSTIPADLADLLGALEPLAEAELAGLIELRVDGLGFRHELARRAIEQSLPEIRRRLLNQRVVDRAAAARAPRPRAAAASRGRGGRCHHAAGGGPGGGARGVAGRLAPAGAVALRGDRPARVAAARGRARLVPGRLRVGALQRAPLPRGGRRRARGRAAVPGARRPATRWRCAWSGSRATCSWRARPTPPRTPRSAPCAWPRDEAALAHATLYLGAILALSRPEEASEMHRARRRLGAALTAARSRRAVPELPRDRARRGRPARGPADDAQLDRAGAGRRASRGDRARLHEPRRAAAARRAGWTSSSAPSAKG